MLDLGVVVCSSCFVVIAQVWLFVCCGRLCGFLVRFAGFRAWFLLVWSFGGWVFVSGLAFVFGGGFAICALWQVLRAGWWLVCGLSVVFLVLRCDLLTVGGWLCGRLVCRVVCLRR